VPPAPTISATVSAPRPASRPLGPVPADRFRIGVGRRDPEAALAALGRFLDGWSRAAD
jgi:hypothetical protein